LASGPYVKVLALLAARINVWARESEIIAQNVMHRNLALSSAKKAGVIWRGEGLRKLLRDSSGKYRNSDNQVIVRRKWRSKNRHQIYTDR